MAVDIILGLQWGDEGKGKLVDRLTEQYDCVVRYQGGDNAGHTVVRDGKSYKLHLIPSGILTEGRAAVIGHGLVVNLESLVSEIETLESGGVATEGLKVSDRAFTVLPSHIRADKSRETGDDSIGTTCKGIGPAYLDKFNRSGVRIGNFFDRDIREKLKGKDLSEEEIDRQLECFEKLRPYVCDTIEYLHELDSSGKSILLEGAQGVMLDIDFGTYPYVTCSSPTPAGGASGSGLPPASIRKVIGVFKAYTTRVGKGPFPTELTGETGEKIRRKGNEFGTTTGRPRRCGWLDFAQMKYAIKVCGVTELAMMKLDVLSGLDEIKAGKSYFKKGTRLDYYPWKESALENVDVEYEIHKGWGEEIAGVREWNSLPERAQAWIEAVEEILERPIGFISTSPDREDVVIPSPAVVG